jgi:hypothetical protein
MILRQSDFVSDRQHLRVSMAKAEDGQAVDEVGSGATSGVKIDSEGCVVNVRGEREGRVHIRCWRGH